MLEVLDLNLRFFIYNFLLIFLNLSLFIKNIYMMIFILLNLESSCGNEMRLSMGRCVVKYKMLVKFLFLEYLFFFCVKEVI